MATKIIILLGPTGVGKTALGVALARYLGSPVINCDSRQIYKEMNIGVARPSPEELAAVTHYFIATHSIHQAYSAGDYEREAWELVMKLAPDHEYLLMVGGSGLYIDAFCDGMDDLPESDPQLREQLNDKLLEPGGMEQLRAQLKLLDSVAYAQTDLSNSRRIIRALEVCLLTGRPYSSFLNNTKKKRPFEIEKIKLERPRAELYERIDRRVDVMMEQGLPDEARELYQFKELSALHTVGYRELFDYFEGKYSLEEAVSLIKRNTRRYAKRQMTYWRDVPKTEDHPLLRLIPFP